MAASAEDAEKRWVESVRKNQAGNEAQAFSASVAVSSQLMQAHEALKESLPVLVAVKEGLEDTLRNGTPDETQEKKSIKLAVQYIEQAVERFESCERDVNMARMKMPTIECFFHTNALAAEDKLKTLVRRESRSDPQILKNFQKSCQPAAAPHPFGNAPPAALYPAPARPLARQVDEPRGLGKRKPEEENTLAIQYDELEEGEERSDSPLLNTWPLSAASSARPQGS